MKKPKKQPKAFTYFDPSAIPLSQLEAETKLLLAWQANWRENGYDAIVKQMPVGVAISHPTMKRFLDGVVNYANGEALANLHRWAVIGLACPENEFCLMVDRRVSCHGFVPDLHDGRFASSGHLVSFGGTDVFFGGKAAFLKQAELIMAYTPKEGETVTDASIIAHQAEQSIGHVIFNPKVIQHGAPGWETAKLVAHERLA